MKKNNLKNLAILVAQEKVVSKKSCDFILKSLNRNNVKAFLYFYRNELQKKRAYVTTASGLSIKSMTYLKTLFKNKEIISTTDASVGAGIKISHNDFIVDYTFKGYLDYTIELLK